MARTPLLRSLIRLASDHRRAEAAGMPIEEFRARRAEAGVSRRQVLAGGAAALAALALPRIGRAARAPRIAIVGGGIAGLSAALTLADNGYASTVYEAAGRIGGRMFSNMNGYWADGQVSEWCGELIDTGHKTVQSLARRFNLPLADLHQAEPNGSTDTYFFAGQYYPAAQADIDFKPVHNALQTDVQAASYPTLYNASTAGGAALDAMSVYDWIDSRVPGGHGSPLGQLLDIAYNIEYGAETTDQSSLNLVYLLGYNASPGNFDIFGASDERYHIIGGNQQLPMAIARQLGSAVQMGVRLQAIAANGDGTCTLTLATAGGTRAEVADIVLLTIPFAVLRTLDYSRAGFDALKQRAIQELGAGRNGKLQLQFTSRLWNGIGAWGLGNGASYADTGYQNTWDVTRAQSGASGILVDYTGGNVTLAMATRVPFTTAANAQARADAQRFLGQIEPVFPGLSARWNSRLTSSIPHLDPNFQLAYSYWRVGQYTAFSGYERVRQGNVFFAGEHCSTDFQGYMEGGASEGIRAANDIIASLGKKAMRALPAVRWG